MRVPLLQPVKGTRDFYPPDCRQRAWLFDCWEQAARRSTFEAYDACVLEHEALYIRKSGEEISEQLYTLVDQSGRRLALRPEMTPSLARMVAARQQALSFPLRWYTIAQCFRYERMTRGRKREHFQWNVDLVGDAGPRAEVEVLCVLIAALKNLGLTAADVQIHLSDRRLAHRWLEALAIPSEQQQAALLIIDKRDKIPLDAFVRLGIERGFSEEQARQIHERFGDEAQAGSLLPEQEALLGLLAALGLEEWCRFDASVVRGLAYYGGLVFEVRDVQRRFRAIAGGGRYDNLLATMGAGSLPAVGFGFGDVVILELLEALGRLPQLTESIDEALLPFGEEETSAALSLAEELRQRGRRVRIYWGPRPLGRRLRQSDADGARRSILLMPDELERGQVRVKDMRDHRESTQRISDLLDAIAR